MPFNSNNYQKVYKTSDSPNFNMGGIRNLLFGVGAIALSYSTLHSQDISAKKKTFVEFAKKYANHIELNNGSDRYFSGIKTDGGFYSYRLDISSKDVVSDFIMETTGINQLEYKMNGDTKEILPDLTKVNVSSTTANKPLDDLIKHYSKKKDN